MILRTTIAALCIASALFAANRTKKDPASREDFTMDFRAAATTNPITASAWDVPTGITKVADTVNMAGTETEIRLEGGTSGRTYQLVNRVTLTDGQILVMVLTVDVVRE